MKSELPSQGFTNIINERISCLDIQFQDLKFANKGRSDVVALRYLRKILTPFTITNLYQHEAEYPISSDFDPELLIPTDMDKAYIAHPEYAACFDMHTIVESFYDIYSNEEDVTQGEEPEDFIELFGADTDPDRALGTIDHEKNKARQLYNKMQVSGILITLEVEAYSYVEKYKEGLKDSLALYGIESPEDIDEKVEEYRQMKEYFLSTFVKITSSR